MPTRRDFLLNCSLLTVGAAMAPVASWATPPQFHEVSLDAIGLEDFRQQVNTTFVLIAAEPARVPLELIRVQPPLPSKAAFPSSPDAGNEKFSLTFRGPIDLLLEQNTYLFTHPDLGVFSLFIVPVTVAEPTSSCAYYQAVFNRPSPKDSSRLPSERSLRRSRRLRGDSSAL